jgi:hypothetical protein
MSVHRPFSVYSLLGVHAFCASYSNSAEFGEYVQAHEEHANTMQTRTTGAIETKPTDNAQGGHWFYSLTTGQMLDRRHWTPLPMPADVIDRIHVLAKASQAGMNFTNMRNEAYTNNDSEDSDDESDKDSDYDSDDESSTGDDDDYDTSIAGVDIHNNSDLPDPPDTNANEINNNDNKEDDDVSADDDTTDDSSKNNNDTDDDTNDVPENNNEIAADADQAVAAPIPKKLKNLTDETGVLYPIIKSRTRQQAQANGESLLITMKTITTKKERRLIRDLLA